MGRGPQNPRKAPPIAGIFASARDREPVVAGLDGVGRYNPPQSRCAPLRLTESKLFVCADNAIGRSAPPNSGFPAAGGSWFPKPRHTF